MLTYCTICICAILGMFCLHRETFPENLKMSTPRDITRKLKDVLVWITMYLHTGVPFCVHAFFVMNLWDSLQYQVIISFRYNRMIGRTNSIAQSNLDTFDRYHNKTKCNKALTVCMILGTYPIDIQWEVFLMKKNFIAQAMGLCFRNNNSKRLRMESIHLNSKGPIIGMHSKIARFMGPTWGVPGYDRTQVGPMLVPWTLRSGLSFHAK